ncbi:hypothetical protein JXR93_05510 [bacterium]|nr:hypothetical protein [bacterium]
MIAHLSSYLIKNSILTPKKVERALQYQVIKSGTLDTIIAEQGYISTPDLQKYISDAHKEDPCYFSLDIMKIKKQLVIKTEREIIENYHVILIDSDSDYVYFLVKANITQSTIEYLEKKYQKKVKYYVVLEVVFEYLLSKLEYKKLSARFNTLLTFTVESYFNFEIDESDVINTPNIQTSISQEPTLTMNEFSPIISETNWTLEKLHKSLKEAKDRDQIIDIFFSYLANYFEFVSFFGKSKETYKIVKYLFSNRKITTQIDFSFDEEELPFLKEISYTTAYQQTLFREIPAFSSLYRKLAVEQIVHVPNQVFIFPLFIKKRVIAFFLLNLKKDQILIPIEVNFSLLSDIATNALESFVLKQKKISENEDKKNEENEQNSDSKTDVVNKDGVYYVVKKRSFEFSKPVIDEDYELISKVKNIENEIETKETIEIPVEAVEPVSETIEIPVETVEPILETIEIPVEAVEPVSETIEIPVEAVEPVSETIEIPVETVEPILETIEIPVEAVEPVSETIEIPVEAVEPVSETIEIPVEAVEPVSETIEIPVEAVEPVSETIEIPVEAVEPVSETIEIPVEAVEPVSETIEIPVEAVEPILETIEIPVEAVEPVSETIEIPVEEDISVEIDESEDISIDVDDSDSDISVDIEIGVFEKSPPTIELNLSEDEVEFQGNATIETYVEDKKQPPTEDDYYEQKLTTFFTILESSKPSDIDEIVKNGNPKIYTHHFFKMIFDKFPGPIWVNSMDYYNYTYPVYNHGPILYLLHNIQSDVDLSVLKEFFYHNDSFKRFYAIYLFTEVKSEEIILELIKRVTDPDKKVASVAVKALENHRLFQSYGKIKYKFESAMHSNLRAIIIDWLNAVRILRDELFVPILIDGLEIWKADKIVKKNIATILFEITKQDFDDSNKKWLKWWEENQYKTRKDWVLDGLQSKDRQVRISSYYDAKKIFSSLFNYTIDLQKKELSIEIDKIKANEDRRF